MKSLKGYILILGGTIFWGVSATFAKFLFARQLEPLILVQTRITFSAVLMLVYFILFKPKFLKIKKSDFYMFALVGIVGIAMSNFTYYFTIQEISVSTAILIQYMAPLLVIIYAAVTKEEVLGWVKITAAAISIGGIYLTVSGKDFSLANVSQIGLITGAASAFCWAFTNVYLRHVLKHYSVWTILVYSFIAGSIFWLFINPPWNLYSANYSAETWMTFIGFAIVSVLIPHTLYFNGLRYITASRAIITGTFEPIVAITASFILLDAFLTPIQIFGAALVITAIVILQIKKEEIQEVNIETT
ncbi:MAG: DMT family transporter [Bacteroidota bacterium]|nr:DMT family transporter [Bacteroidota bacterium]